MNGEEAERLTAEALRRFATPEAAAAYLDQIRAKADEMRDYERRLTTVGDKVDSIAREQKIEAGRREGAAVLVQRAERASAERNMWARSLLPVMIALGVYLVAQFVGDAVSVAQTAAEAEK